MPGGENAVEKLHRGRRYSAVVLEIRVSESINCTKYGHRKQKHT